MDAFTDLLMEVNRKSQTRKPMLVIKPHRFNEFLERLKASDLPLQFKAFMAVSLSGGMRVSEVLKLRPFNFKGQDSFRFKVSKKQETVQTRDNRTLDAYSVYRNVILGDVALALLAEWQAAKKADPLKRLGTQRHFARIFTYNRNQIDFLCKKYFGPTACHHSIARHSKISYLLDNHGMPANKVANLHRIRLDTVAQYSHTDDFEEGAKINAKLKSE